MDAIRLMLLILITCLFSFYLYNIWVIYLNKEAVTSFVKKFEKFKYFSNNSDFIYTDFTAEELQDAEVDRYEKWRCQYISMYVSIILTNGDQCVFDTQNQRYIDDALKICRSYLTFNECIEDLFNTDKKENQIVDIFTDAINNDKDMKKALYALVKNNFIIPVQSIVVDDPNVIVAQYPDISPVLANSLYV